jgi:hypothetical protein
MLSTLLLLSLAIDPSITMLPKTGQSKGKVIVFLAGDEEYRGEEGLPMLAKILSQRHGFTCTCLFPLNPDGTINPDISESLSDPDQLDKADGIVMMLRFRRYPDAVMEKLAAAINRGVPIIALRTSTHAFQFKENSVTSYRTFNDFGRNVLGENWVSHWGPNRKGLTRGVREDTKAAQTLLRGVNDVIGDSGVYEAHPVSDANILLRGQVLSGMKPTDPPATWTKKWSKDGSTHGANEPMMPIAWSRENKAKSGKTNRVFCTTMGAATDLESEGLRRLIINAVYWGFSLEVPVNADVNYVDAYQPTPYGFKGYRRSIIPADHAVGKILKAGPTK